MYKYCTVFVEQKNIVLQTSDQFVNINCHSTVIYVLWFGITSLMIKLLENICFSSEIVIASNVDIALKNYLKINVVQLAEHDLLVLMVIVRLFIEISDKQLRTASTIIIITNLSNLTINLCTRLIKEAQRSVFVFKIEISPNGKYTSPGRNMFSWRPVRLIAFLEHSNSQRLPYVIIRQENEKGNPDFFYVQAQLITESDCLSQKLSPENVLKANVHVLNVNSVVKKRKEIEKVQDSTILSKVWFVLSKVLYFQEKNYNIKTNLEYPPNKLILKKAYIRAFE
uniref:Uncharacterized protein n=1 Tax=Glossina brevipalpis TaxID=37001 RepID=A0A1A9WXN8_9MUSC